MLVAVYCVSHRSMTIRNRIEQHPDIAKYNGAISDSYPKLEGSGKQQSIALVKIKESQTGTHTEYRLVVILYLETPFFVVP